MRTRDFSFELPERLVAQEPAADRGGDRLMVLSRADGSTRHLAVADLPSLIDPGTLMVLNDTRVRKARLAGTALDTGSRAEFLLLERESERVWKGLVPRARRHRPGRRYAFPDGVTAILLREEGELRVLEFSSPVTDDYLDRNGHIPLPPYIRREAGSRDEERYQTVYADATGSVAAPTAGLHFTGELLDRLRERGVEIRRLTLHVGLGTFRPIRTERVEEHRMHTEGFLIPDDTADAVDRAKREGRPVLAVGTTSVRALESAWDGNGLRRGYGETDLFIYPGYRFGVVDRIFTNFHTPESSLLVMISAFAGEERIRAAYREAVEKEYRFFSYGDAMLIL